MSIAVQLEEAKGSSAPTVAEIKKWLTELEGDDPAKFYERLSDEMGYGKVPTGYEFGQRLKRVVYNYKAKHVHEWAKAVAGAFQKASGKSARKIEQALREPFDDFLKGGGAQDPETRESYAAKAYLDSAPKTLWKAALGLWKAGRLKKEREHVAKAIRRSIVFGMKNIRQALRLEKPRARYSLRGMLLNPDEIERWEREHGKKK